MLPHYYNHECQWVPSRWRWNCKSSVCKSETGPCLLINALVAKHVPSGFEILQSLISVLLVCNDWRVFDVSRPARSHQLFYTATQADVDLYRSVRPVFSKLRRRKTVPQCMPVSRPLHTAYSYSRFWHFWYRLRGAQPLTTVLLPSLVRIFA